VDAQFGVTKTNTPATNVVSPKKVTPAEPMRIWDFKDTITATEILTHYHVTADERPMKFMVARMGGRSAPSKDQKTILRKEYLNTYFGYQGISWEIDDKNKTIRLDFAWHKQDPRSEKELMQVIHEFPRYAYSPDGRISNDSLWAKAFNALLSKKKNFSKAWETRVRQDMENLLCSPKLGIDLQLVDRIETSEMKNSTVIVVRNQIANYPGESSMCCYWFDEEGTLLGADCVTTGWRSELVAVTRAFDLEVMARGFGDYYLERFTITKHGLKCAGGMGSDGKPIQAEQFGFGKSLLKFTP